MPASEQPLVSIILCTYNRVRLLRRAIRSVQAQRYTRWELLIIDDGSTDQTSRMLSAFPARDDRIIVVRQPNRGLARARNTGLDLATGDFICFLDSDDEFRPTHLLSRVSRMQRTPGTDMLHGGLLVRGPRRKRYVADLDRPGRLVHVKDCYVGGTFFLRRRIISRGYRFKPVAFGEDRDLFRRLQNRFRIVRVKGPRTYVYHCEATDRLCDAYTKEHAVKGR